MAESARPGRNRLLELLEDRGAATRHHVNGSLLDHLLGTERLLQSWRCSDRVRLAGLAHASYGTDGFAEHLLELDEHQLLRDAAGEDVEALVYLYSSCDRATVYPQLLGSGRVSFHDRFTGERFEATKEQVRDFADVTIANETELFVVATEAKPPEWLVDLYQAVQKRVSDGARRGAANVLGLR